MISTSAIPVALVLFFVLSDDMIIGFEKLENFKNNLYAEDKSENTVEKYVRDVRLFLEYLNGREIDGIIIKEYKKMLSEKYKMTSVNSMIASLNKFLRFLGLGDLVIKQFKIQREVYLSEARELTRKEYELLVKTAYEKNDDTIALIMETIAATGIRVSEIGFITYESLATGEFTVSLKGKTRKVMMVNSLCRKLRIYCRKMNIRSGSIFCLSRNSIWKKMKVLAKRAGISLTKVFPHNLRHLFARCFYELEKDIVKLSDVLGHTNINTTRIYLIASGRRHRELLERMKMVVDSA